MCYNDCYISSIKMCLKCNNAYASPIWCFKCYHIIFYNTNLKCYFCDYRSNKDALSNHMKFLCKSNPQAKCHEDNTAKCPSCERIFKSEGGLKNHFNRSGCKP